MPTPAAFTAAIEKDQKAFVGVSPLIARLVAVPAALTVVGFASGAGTHWPLSFCTTSS